MSRPKRTIDLVKRDRLIAKYVPGLLEPEPADADEGEPDLRFTLDDLLARVPKGTDVGRLFARADEFLGLSADQAAAKLLEMNARPEPPLLTVAIEDFFDGNDDPSTIGNGAFSRIEDVRGPLMEIRARPDVLDVRVSINEWPDPRQRGDDDMWPLAENLYIWTTAPIEQLREWVQPLRPDGLWECPPGQIGRGDRAAPLDVVARVVCVMWD